jgi:hypothetical protein
MFFNCNKEMIEFHQMIFFLMLNIILYKRKRIRIRIYIHNIKRCIQLEIQHLNKAKHKYSEKINTAKTT